MVHINYLNNVYKVKSNSKILFKLIKTKQLVQYILKNIKFLFVTYNLNSNLKKNMIQNFLKNMKNILLIVVYFLIFIMYKINFIIIKIKDPYKSE